MCQLSVLLKNWRPFFGHYCRFYLIHSFTRVPPIISGMQEIWRSSCRAPFCGAPVRPNMLNMPKSTAALYWILINIGQFCCRAYLPTRRKRGSRWSRDVWLTGANVWDRLTWLGEAINFCWLTCWQTHRQPISPRVYQSISLTKLAMPSAWYRPISWRLCFPYCALGESMQRQKSDS